MPSRRSFLAAVTVSAPVAGCLDWGPTGHLQIELSPASPETAGERRLVEPADLPPSDRRLLAEGVPDGTDWYGHRPVTAEEYVHVDRTYYAVSVSDDGTGVVERPTLVAGPDPVEDPDGTTGAYADLPERDRDLVQRAVATEADWGAVIRHLQRSTVWPDPPFEYVNEGREGYYRLSPARREARLPRRRYEFDPVAGARRAFGRYYLQHEYDVDISDLDVTEKQREMLATAAREGRYREDSPYEQLDDLVDAVRDRVGESRHRVLIRFEGQYYYFRWGQAHA